MKFKLLNNPNDSSRLSWPDDLRNANVTELVYGCRVAPHSTRFCVRVYSGIWLAGHSRGVGEDAIRVLMVWLDIEPYESGESEKPIVKIVGTTKRVHRIKTWATNLKSRICQWEELQGPTCPKCGKPTIERERKRDKKKFWSCIGYRVDGPDHGCDFTANIT
jgi:hypothetical protein